jgi:hypothetical protein
LWKETNISEVHAAPIFTLNMEAAWTSETFVSSCNIAQHHSPENLNLNIMSVTVCGYEM